MRENTNRTRGMGSRMLMGQVVMCALALVVSGCSLSDLLGSEDLPENVTDPAITETPRGALRAYHGTVSAFRTTFNAVMRDASRLSDELQTTPGQNNPDFVDMRETPEGGEDNFDSYGDLHRVRGQAMQAIGLQKDFAPDSLSELTGHLYAIQAYAEIFLADLFCSGIPLSTLDYEGDFTYQPGSTTEQVYEHAVALLDTALMYTGEDESFENLAHVGRARALLNLGRFADAAEAASAVPDAFRYAVEHDVDVVENFIALNTADEWWHTVADVEGGNGLDYGSSGDPRTQVTPVPGRANGTFTQFPAKYRTDGLSPTVLASGIEARLVEAEAALNDGNVGTWLNRLNHLRQTMWTTIVPAVSDPLPDLADPGTHEARVDLLYRERAFWLFMTAQRQGDLRRLIRHYARAQDQVYPTGPYPGAPGMWYGSNVDLPVWEEERVSNPYFDGCFSR